MHLSERVRARVCVCMLQCGVCVKCIKELRSFQNDKSPDLQLKRKQQIKLNCGWRQGEGTSDKRRWDEADKQIKWTSFEKSAKYVRNAKNKATFYGERRKQNMWTILATLQHQIISFQYKREQITFSNSFSEKKRENTEWWFIVCSSYCACLVCVCVLCVYTAKCYFHSRRSAEIANTTRKKKKKKKQTQKKSHLI